MSTLRALHKDKLTLGLLQHHSNKKYTVSAFVSQRLLRVTLSGL